MEMPARRAVLLDRGHTADEMEMPARRAVLLDPTSPLPPGASSMEMPARRAVLLDLLTTASSRGFWVWKCLRERLCFPTVRDPDGTGLATPAQEGVS